jgi:hypothetical protein
MANWHSVLAPFTGGCDETHNFGSIDSSSYNLETHMRVTLYRLQELFSVVRKQVMGQATSPVEAYDGGLEFGSNFMAGSISYLDVSPGDQPNERVVHT